MKIQQFVRSIFENHHHHDHHHFLIFLSTLLILGLTLYIILSRPTPVYLIDYSCYQPPHHLRVQFHQFMEQYSKLTNDFHHSSLKFQRRILQHSGLGEETYVPPALLYIPPRPSMLAAREEFIQVMFGALDNLFDNTNVELNNIGILGVNCSLYRGRVIECGRFPLRVDLSVTVQYGRPFRNIMPSLKNPWEDCIHRYPVHIVA